MNRYKREMAKALEISIFLTDKNQILQKSDIYDGIEYDSEYQFKRSLSLGVEKGLFHRIGKSSSIRYVSAKKYTARLEKNYEEKVIAEAKRKIEAKKTESRKQTMKAAEAKRKEERSLAIKEARKERATRRRREQRQRIKSEAKKEKARIERELAEEMKAAEEEAYKEQSIRLEVESIPPKVKAKFIGHDTEQRTSHRRIGAFYWFKAEQNGGECIGARA